MLRIGVTGGIGSGKSTVCAVFSQLGIPVYSADSAAKRLMREDAALRSEILEAFGPQSYSGTEPNRAFLAAAVFGNPEKREILNQLVHPAVFKDFEHWCAQQHAPYVIKEAAIMFESGSYKQVDEVIAVTAPVSLRLKRVVERDGLNEAEVLRRMEAQMPQEELQKRAQYCIQNDGTQSLIEQVLALHLRFTKTAENPVKP